MEANPDIAFDFFGMCMRFLRLSQETKSLFFSSSHLDQVLKVWICGIGLEHRDAIKTHTEFMIALINILKKELKEVLEGSQPANAK